MVQKFRAFVASPGDVSAERDALGRVVEEIDQIHGPPLGYNLELVKYETHTAPGGGRAQQVITDQIGTYDIFVGVMWRRFGTPTGGWGSGTEEEYRNAWKAFEQNPDMVIMFYFCQEPFMPDTPDEIAQMQKVLLFRQELEGKSLVWKYKDKNEFENTIRKHLCLRLSRMIKERAEGTGFRAKPNEGSILELRSLWDRMEPELQKAMSVAYNENRQAGDPGIQTRDLFAALLRVGSPEIKKIVEDIPSEALPPATSGIVIDEPYIVEERPWLSGCVSSSIHRLCNTLPAGQKLTSADIFADIAKNGTGTSVRLLRENDIKPEDIDRILLRKNIQVVQT